MAVSITGGSLTVVLLNSKKVDLMRRAHSGFRWRLAEQGISMNNHRAILKAWRQSLAQAAYERDVYTPDADKLVRSIAYWSSQTADQAVASGGTSELA